jgi:nucleotidyltransferase/DNA polymerase involved in DNA repair
MQLPNKRRPEFDEARAYVYAEHLRPSLDSLLQTPGVYVFHGHEGDLPLYIGKSVNLRARVLLLDGNNFYASCERVFEPKLLGRPVVVLSNNDGCAIARSEEAKALGIKMGTPWFQIRHLEHEAGLVALSANFALYGDMSSRMMEIAEPLGCGQEIYSIDECFLDLSGMRDASQRARQTRQRVQQWVGLPTCTARKTELTWC